MRQCRRCPCEVGCSPSSLQNTVSLGVRLLTAGLFDELQPTECRDAASALVQAWLADVSTLEQQQTQLQQQRQEMKDAKHNLQQLFVAAACALRTQGNTMQECEVSPEQRRP